MIFSKETILKNIQGGKIVITPFKEEHLKSASYTLTLDLSSQDSEKIVLEGGSFVLLKTIERITLSDSIACLITTTGTIAKEGVDTVQSSIFCETDTDNQITLEISNSRKDSVQLVHGMKIAKAVFVQVI